MKNTLIKYFLLFLFISAPVFAQQETLPWWLFLEQGKQRFRSGDYGGALLVFEDARRNRNAMYGQMERDFIHLLSLRELRSTGDALDGVEKFSHERHYTAASAALNELFYRVPKDSLNNSALAALAAIGKLKNYPEAEYWIGEVYRVEGELTLALEQYRKAYEMRDLFEDTGFATQLLYKISGVLMVKQDYSEMINVLLSIVNNYDTLWVNAGLYDSIGQSAARAGNGVNAPYEQASASFARKAMTNTLEKEGVNRFLELYRYNNRQVEQAHRLLGFYYIVSGRDLAQQHLMFAFLIQNTVIIDEIKRLKYDFAFTSLLDLAGEINKNPLLLSYVNEVEYYKTAYYLASSLLSGGKLSIARNIWEFLASVPQAGEWHNRSVSQSRNPALEPILEKP
ncbi:MAG: hypothetical protein LBH16_00315 [Treponema sp.]|jgi:tetratricopeptide (TPR) repeat protein|nr:hypothetical protein [Treponema sp.]